MRGKDPNLFALMVVVAVVAAITISILATTINILATTSESTTTSQEKTIQWEYLEGENGTDLQRTEIPGGWIVEGADGYLVVVDDPGKEWLKDE